MKDVICVYSLFSVELLIDGSSVVGYPFIVVPQMDAIPTVEKTSIFAADITDDIEHVDAKDLFSPNEIVFIIERGDFGRLSYIQAEWNFNGDQ
jgi:hypothetical protein